MGEERRAMTGSIGTRVAFLVRLEIDRPTRTAAARKWLAESEPHADYSAALAHILGSLPRDGRAPRGR
jgi:hypothetical protein